MPPTFNKKIYVLLIIITIGVLIMLGLNLLSRFGINIPWMGSSQNQTDSFFEAQNATLTGTITKISGGKATVKNKQGKSKEFKIAKNVVISGSSSAIPNPGQPLDLTKIKTDEEVVIFFTAVNNQFEITSIAKTTVIAPPSNFKTETSTSSGTVQLAPTTQPASTSTQRR